MRRSPGSGKSPVRPRTQRARARSLICVRLPAGVQGAELRARDPLLPGRGSLFLEPFPVEDSTASRPFRGARRCRRSRPSDAPAPVTKAPAPTRSATATDLERRSDVRNVETLSERLAARRTRPEDAGRPSRLGDGTAKNDQPASASPAAPSAERRPARREPRSPRGGPPSPRKAARHGDEARRGERRLGRPREESQPEEERRSRTSAGRAPGRRERRRPRRPRRRRRAAAHHARRLPPRLAARRQDRPQEEEGDEAREAPRRRASTRSPETSCRNGANGPVSAHGTARRRSEARRHAPVAGARATRPRRTAAASAPRSAQGRAASLRTSSSTTGRRRRLEVERPRAGPARSPRGLVPGAPSGRRAGSCVSRTSGRTMPVGKRRVTTRCPRVSGLRPTGDSWARVSCVTRNAAAKRPGARRARAPGRSPGSPAQATASPFRSRRTTPQPLSVRERRAEEGEEPARADSAAPSFDDLEERRVPREPPRRRGEARRVLLERPAARRPEALGPSPFRPLGQRTEPRRQRGREPRRGEEAEEERGRAARLQRRIGIATPCVSAQAMASG